MPADTMNPATAVTWGPFIAAAAQQYTSDPSQLNPATITGMPAGYTLVRTIQMSDFFGPQESRAFYGLVAVGGLPGEGEVEPRLRPRAEHLHARAVACHGAAGSSLQLTAVRSGRVTSARTWVGAVVPACLDARLRSELWHGRS